MASTTPTTIISLLCVLAIGVSASYAFGVEKRSVAVATHPQDFRPNCQPRGSPLGGCRCSLTNEHGVEETIQFNTDAECRKPVELQTAENKQKMQEELLKKVGGMRDNCFPKPSGGCRCTVTNHGAEETVTFDDVTQCRKPVEIQTAENKAAVQDELKGKSAGLKENCFPRPGSGCRCVEKDAEGAEVEKRYDTEAECKVPAGRAHRRLRRDLQQHRAQSPSAAQQDIIRSGKDQPRPQSPPSQNVRDPVREKAQANYALVLEELKEKFKGLKEGCYPRPKGCLCVTGKDVDGRDITDRRMNDADCKCREGERSRDCPARGA